MERRPTRKNAETRAAIAARFKLLCQQAGLRVPEVAQTLHVTERTVYAWFSGKTAVPYSAYRLLRILNRFELPGWDGWHMHSGKLWTPEGFGIDAHEGAWWSLLVRQARAFKALYEAQRAARSEAAPADTGREARGARTGQAERRRCGPRAARPNLFQSHIATEDVAQHGRGGCRGA